MLSLHGIKFRTVIVALLTTNWISFQIRLSLSSPIYSYLSVLIENNSFFNRGERISGERILGEIILGERISPPQIFWLVMQCFIVLKTCIVHKKIEWIILLLLANHTQAYVFIAIIFIFKVINGILYMIKWSWTADVLHKYLIAYSLKNRQKSIHSFDLFYFIFYFCKIIFFYQILKVLWLCYWS